jgi:hypothetical protein
VDQSIMVNGDANMTSNYAFDPSSYRLTRNEVLSKVNSYLKIRTQQNITSSKLVEIREDILRFTHNELLIA